MMMSREWTTFTRRHSRPKWFTKLQCLHSISLPWTQRQWPPGFQCPLQRTQMTASLWQHANKNRLHSTVRFSQVPILLNTGASQINASTRLTCVSEYSYAVCPPVSRHIPGRRRRAGRHRNRAPRVPRNWVLHREVFRSHLQQARASVAWCPPIGAIYVTQIELQEDTKHVRLNAESTRRRSRDDVSQMSTAEPLQRRLTFALL